MVKYFVKKHFVDGNGLTNKGLWPYFWVVPVTFTTRSQGSLAMCNTITVCFHSRPQHPYSHIGLAIRLWGPGTKFNTISINVWIRGCEDLSRDGLVSRRACVAAGLSRGGLVSRRACLAAGLSHGGLVSRWACLAAGLSRGGLVWWPKFRLVPWNFYPVRFE